MMMTLAMKSYLSALLGEFIGCYKKYVSFYETGLYHPRNTAKFNIGVEGLFVGHAVS